MANVGAPEGNKNAEIWTEEEAISFFEKAVKLSDSEEYDFIGEVAKDLGQDKGVFDYLIDKFPYLSKQKSRIKSNCETNCFRNSKKGKINTAIGIVNLKSNHGWTDRTDITTKDDKVNTAPIIKFVDSDETDGD